MYLFQNMYLARSLSEAFALFDAHPAARWIAGGSDVLIQLRSHDSPQAELISIQQIDALRGISLLQDGTLQIRPLACFTDVSHDPVVNALVPALAYAAGQVGGPQIRHIGTIGGNICNGVTSADTASTLLAYDAELEITSRSGKRQMRIHEFYLGPKKVNLAPGELLTAILIRPGSYTGYRGTYTKFSARRAMDIATLGCSVNLRLSADGSKLERLRLAYGVAAPVPIRAFQTEEKFQAAPVTPDLAAQISQHVLAELRPRDSWRASAEYRLALAQELTQRALEQLLYRQEVLKA